jgi:hypothetical protein
MLTSLTVELLSIQDNRWKQFLERCSHDIYHSPDYCSVSARVDCGVAQCILVQHDTEGLLLPIIRRELPGGLWDATSPYGYPGPVWTRKTDQDNIDKMFEIALSGLGEAGCVSLFLRMHPGLNSHWPKLAAQHTVRRNSSETVYVDLALSDREIWSELRAGHRSTINRAERLGYRVMVDHEASYLYDFAQLYRENMSELNANPYYYFKDEYFRDLRNSLGAAVSLVVVLRESKLVGGAIFTSCGDWIQYHLSAADQAHRSASPATLVIDERRRWGQEQGYRWLHLGGGRGGAADPLFRFKSGFSSSRLTFRTAGIIFRPQDYSDLVRTQGQEHSSRVGNFPEYRFPLTDVRSIRES